MRTSEHHPEQTGIPSAAAGLVRRARALASGRWPGRFAATFLAQSMAIHFRRSSQSIWLHGDDPQSFDEATMIVSLLKQNRAQHRLIMTSGDPDTFAWLRGRFVDEARFPSPVGWAPVLRRMFGLLAPKALLVLESPAGLDRGVMNKVRRAGVPILVFGAGRENPRGVAALRPDHVCARDEEAAALLRGAGIPADRITVTGDPAFEAVPPVITARREYLRKELRLPDHVPVILAERIGPDEEAMVSDLLGGLRRSHPELVLLIEPRRRRQLRSLTAVLAARGLRVRRRSDSGGPADVILMDQPGEVAGFYPAADVVLAGGSLGGAAYPAGPIGALLAGVPVVYGPQVPPQAAAVRLALEGGMARQGAAGDLGAVVEGLLSAGAGRAALAARAEQAARQYAGASRRAFEAFERFLPPAGAERRVVAAWRVRGLVQKMAGTRPGSWIVEKQSRRRIDTWDRLNERLGRPKTILCLGNGPSCEDPRLRDVRYDSLFRINYLWKRRGFLVDPDLVFVGNPATMREVSGCVFAFREIAVERAAVLANLLRLRFAPPEIFTLQRAGSYAAGVDQYARPTNGSLMVVTAAALQPERIVIAGIDLFAHPDGRYPGDLGSRNQYGAMHARQTDLGLIRRALKEFRGEVVILGDILREALAQGDDEAGVPVGAGRGEAP